MRLRWLWRVCPCKRCKSRRAPDDYQRHIDAHVEFMQRYFPNTRFQIPLSGVTNHTPRTATEIYRSRAEVAAAEFDAMFPLMRYIPNTRMQIPIRYVGAGGVAKQRELLARDQRSPYSCRMR